jgi:hypothetical protein
MKPVKDWEFHLFRFYRSRFGFWLAFWEVVSHSEARAWALVQGGKNGGKVEVLFGRGTPEWGEA